LPSNRAAGLQFKASPGCGRVGNPENKGEIGRRHIADCFVGPLDQTHGIVPKVFAKTGIFKLFCFIETIKIKVIPV